MAAVVAPFLLARWGWQSVFLFTGAVGFAWAVLWVPIYRNPATPHPTPPLMCSRRSCVRRWNSLLAHRQTWAISAGKMLTDPAWWFYVNWLPKFMNEHHHLDILHVGPPLMIIYVMADIGSVSGGWLSSALLARLARQPGERLRC